MANEWVEQRAETLRLAVGFRGRPRENPIWSVYELLDGGISLRWSGGTQGKCRIHASGRSFISLPAQLTGRALDEAACHEIAHALLSVGMGPMLYEDAKPDDWGLRRLAESHEARDEARARQFVSAWYLPSTLVKEHRGKLSTLVEESGCTWDVVRERVRSLAGRVYTIAEPPRWSAHRRYHVICRVHPRRPALSVALRNSTSPVYDFPVTAYEVNRSAMRMNAELVALTVDEFELVYQPFRVDVPEPCSPTLDDLRNYLQGAE